MTAIAIDGPAGAGKSTVARAVADALGFDYVDTGALYRAVTLAALDRTVDILDGTAVAAIASEVAIESAGGAITLDGVDVTREIRRRDVTTAVSVVSAHPQVRRALLELQRRAARDADVVMEGRDIGTKVLPDASLKVFLTASLDERTERRGRELDLDDPGALHELRKSIATRDRHDASRTESPLAQAVDAVVIDTTRRTVEDVTNEIVALAREDRP